MGNKSSGINPHGEGQSQVQPQTQAALPAPKKCFTVDEFGKYDAQAAAYARERKLNEKQVVSSARSFYPEWRIHEREMQYDYNQYNGAEPYWDDKNTDKHDIFVDFAKKHGNLNVDALKFAVFSDQTKLDKPVAKIEYNKQAEEHRKRDEPIPFWLDDYDSLPMRAPTVRGAPQCYCLVCKRAVKPVGARIVGNRRCGTCPLCRRKVCTFVAKTQARQQPARRRAHVKKAGKKMKKSA